MLFAELARCSLSMALFSRTAPLEKARPAMAKAVARPYPFVCRAWSCTNVV